MSAELGLVSNVMVDDDPRYSDVKQLGIDEDQELLDQIIENTKAVTKAHFGGDDMKIQENRVYQHLLLT
jgi:hypothetical protein